MRELISKRGLMVVMARTTLEVSGFLVAAGLVAWSAVSAKHAQMGPAPAMAMASVDTQSRPVLAATVEPVVEAPAEVAELVEAMEDAGLDVELTEAEPEDVFGPDSGFERYFDGRPVRPVRTMWMTVTAYSPDHRSCGKWADGITASNKSVWTNAMRLVAADKRILPFGSLVSVPGYADGEIVPVLDIGGAIKGARLDVLYPTHSIARQWGVQRLPVVVWEYAD